MTSQSEKSKAISYLGVDTGGTFTDFVCIDESGLRIHKVLSTPAAPEQAILQGIEELGLQAKIADGHLHVVHGSTVATNAALENKGVKTVYVTNAGFKDLLTLGRQNRPHIYALNPVAELPPVSAELCLEVSTRRDHRGRLLEPLSEQELVHLRETIEHIQPQAVAINLLYSFLAEDEERRIEALLQEHYFVSRSSEVLPEYKEYERGMATWLNAWLGPLVAGYLERLREALAGAPLAVMQSNGGTIDASQAARKAVNLLLSGPAGGLAAAMHIGKQIGSSQLLTFDMGGTSTDVALLNGAIGLTTESRLGAYPVAVATVDMHTIGAGGGSIAYLDEAGMLHVGPQSAGAKPGPACYGLGGRKATVTDANLVLGRLQAESFLGGAMNLDINAAQRACADLAQALGVGLEQAAEGIITLANEHMVKALRVISVQRGVDPRAYTLCCFGGAGGLHVCALARALGVSKIVVPANGGVFSALGMLVAPRSRNLSKSILRPLTQQNLAYAQPLARELCDQATEQLQAEGVSADLSVTLSLECRYQGQSFVLALPWSLSDSAVQLEQAFHRAHLKQFGHQMPLTVELVNVRVQVAGAGQSVAPSLGTDWGSGDTGATRGSAKQQGQTRSLWRAELSEGESLAGPVLICEQVSTTYVALGWCARVDQWGHLHLSLMTDSEA